MNTQQNKFQRKTRRMNRTRSRIFGTAERPRLSVHRSIKHVRAQIINDADGKTIVAVDDSKLTGTKSERAMGVGKRIAEAAQAKGVSTVIFDRGPYRYHGRVKALADSAREAGLKF
jgi:large subunit ribosomal protein L18